MPKKYYNLKCSNCLATAYYPKEEIDNLFPFSREKTLCKNCGSTLSVCSGFLSLCDIPEKSLIINAEKEDAIRIMENLADKNPNMKLNSYLKKMEKDVLVLN
jgi:hypothetical protein